MKTVAAALVASLLAVTASAAPARPSHDARAAAFVAEVKAGLDLTLKDYPSARFQKVHLAFTPAGHRIVCGMVNGKNSEGGYVGWQYFWVDASNQKPFAIQMSELDGCSDYDVEWLPQDFSAAVAH